MGGPMNLNLLPHLGGKSPSPRPTGRPLQFPTTPFPNSVTNSQNRAAFPTTPFPSQTTQSPRGRPTFPTAPMAPRSLQFPTSPSPIKLDNVQASLVNKFNSILSRSKRAAQIRLSPLDQTSEESA